MTVEVEEGFTAEQVKGVNLNDLYAGTPAYVNPAMVAGVAHPNAGHRDHEAPRR